MKPLHVLTAAAILVVAALVAFLAMHGDERTGGHRPGTQAAGTGARGPGTGPLDADAGGAAAAGSTPGSPATGTTPEDLGPNSVTLRIVDPDDAPSSDADVVLDRGADALRAKADEMGVLLVHDLKPGVYDLRARHGKLAGALRFETKGELDLGTLRLTATVTITGHVYGPESEPLGNALVEARRAITEEGAAPRVPLPEETAASVTTDAKGAYALVVPAGEAYGLRATARELAPANREPALFAADTAGVDLYLKEGAILTGRVIAGGDRPVPGARVLVGDARAADDNQQATGETLTDDDGRFSLFAEPGVRGLLVIAAGCARRLVVVVAPATGIVITLDPGTSLRLEAVEAGRAGAPAAHVTATVTYLGGSSAGETDDLGRLLLEGLPIDPRAVSGQRLRLSGAGYLPLEIDLARVQPVGGLLDLGTVELTRGGVVTGRVLDRTTGEPIGGARVGAFGGRPGQIVAASMASGVSAQDGSFRLDGVPLDAHTLTAWHPHFVDESLPTTSGGGSGGPILFREGSREATRDVNLIPAEKITGVVLAPDDTPVTEAVVSVVDDQRGRVARLLGGEATTAKSDGKGAFVLEGFLPVQRVRLIARHPDYGKSDEVDAIAGEPATLRLKEPLTLGGLVTDPSGMAIEGVRVEAAGRTATTDRAGRFLVRNLPIGRLHVRFEHPDYLPMDIEVRFLGSMELGGTVLDPGASIAGVVVRDDQVPAPGVVVHATREPTVPLGRSSATAVTDAKGKFEIRAVNGGDYRLRVRTKDTCSTEVAARTGARDVRIVLVPAGRLLGRVAAQGVAVAGARVRAEQQGTLLGWARSAEDGTFEISLVPAESPFEVVIEHDLFRPLRIGDVVASDRPRTFSLEPGGDVSGVVVDGRGSAVAGAEVLVRVNGRDARRVVTDAQGVFEARGLDEGRIAVALVGAEGGILPTGWVEVAAGARSVRLVAAGGASISGILRYSNGMPAHGVSVTAIDEEGRRVASVWAWEADGSFEVRGLRRGRYTVRAEQNVGQKRAGEATGIDAGTRNVEIRLEP